MSDVGIPPDKLNEAVYKRLLEARTQELEQAQVEIDRLRRILKTGEDVARLLGIMLGEPDA
jgi:hypothetical protein